MTGSEVLDALRERRSWARLVAPAPGPAELAELLAVATAAPDHGRLRPWRFVVVDEAARGPLGETFAAAHCERDPDATARNLEHSRDKPMRAPMIVVVVASPVAHPKVPQWEQHASAAAVAHGLVLAADLAGFGAMWRTGWYGDAPKVRAHLGLTAEETVTGWVYLGTPSGSRPAARPVLPAPVTYLR
ncbi:MAG: nitroreductase [Pseudonocardia sp.]|nr:nitroreductase [Pseudonocardia sp.]